MDLTLKLKSLPDFTVHEVFYDASGKNAIALDYTQRQIAHLSQIRLSAAERHAVNARVAASLEFDQEYLNGGYLSRKIRLHTLREEALSQAATTLRLNPLDDIYSTVLIENGTPIPPACSLPGRPETRVEANLLQRMGTRVAAKLGVRNKPPVMIATIAVCMLFQNENHPRFTMDFLDGTTEKHSDTYQSAVQSAQQLYAAIQVGLQQKPAPALHVVDGPADPFIDTLHKLSQLHSQGLITSEELHLLKAGLRMAE